MAGSYNHCVHHDNDVSAEDQGKFRGVDLLDHLGDAYEALEEMYGMIWWLASFTGSDDVKALVEVARQNYKDGLKMSPGIKLRED